MRRENMRVLLTSFPLTIVINTAVLCSSTTAEIPNLNVSDLEKGATLIATGKLQRIYSRTEKSSDKWETTYSIAEIQVRRLNKGEHRGPLLYARFWHKRYNGKGPAPPGHYGHRGVPIQGDAIRVYVKRAEDGGFDVLSPNGFEPLELDKR